MKKIISTLLALAIIFSMSIPAFAAAVPVEGTTSTIGTSDEIAPCAVSGEGHATGSRTSFKIYSPGSSWFAHMDFKVLGNGTDEVAISVTDPNGRLLTYFGGTGFFKMKQNTSRYYNFNDAPAGYYTIAFNTSFRDVVTVYASLHDWHIV